MKTPPFFNLPLLADIIGRNKGFKPLTAIAAFAKIIPTKEVTISVFVYSFRVSGYKAQYSYFQVMTPER
jgi:hypothetical protein